MKRFKYKAKTTKGTTVNGLVEGINKKQAARILQERNLTVFSLQEKNLNKFNFLLNIFHHLSSKDITEFTRQLATMIGAGLSLIDSLIILQEQSKPAMAKIIEDIIKEVEGGSSFHKALLKHTDVFSKIYLALIKSGETAGSLDEVLKKMASSLEKQEEFKSKVKGAMIYPIIVVIGMIGVIFIMMVYVVPKLTSMYEEFGTTLPMSTQILINFSKFMTKFWPLVFIFFGGGIYGFRYWKKTANGRRIFDRLMLKLPVVGVLKTKIILTDITRTFSMLLGAGVSVIEGLNIVAEAANNVIFEESIRKAAKSVEKGFPLTTTFEKFEEYPPIFTQMVSVGEETGKLDEILARLSKQFEMESETAVKGLTSAIEPLMMVVLGIGVGFIVISIITPIYNLTSQF